MTYRKETSFYLGTNAVIEPEKPEIVIRERTETIDDADPAICLSVYDNQSAIAVIFITEQEAKELISLLQKAISILRER